MLALVESLGVDVTSSEGPLLHRRRLGAELRQLRGDRTLEEIADATLISTSKLSRLETGQGVAHPRDIRDLVDYHQLDAPTAERLRRWANAGRSQSWWREYSTALTSGLDTYLDYETGASILRNFSLAMVPPLLQTPDYATDLYRWLRPRTEKTVRKLVEGLGRRKKIVIDSAPQLVVVLDKAVLRPLESPHVMREQLDHLHAAFRCRNVSLRLAPFSVGLTRARAASSLPCSTPTTSTVVSAPSSPTPVNACSNYRRVCLEYLRIFDTTCRKALDHDESRVLIVGPRDDIPRQ